MKKKKSKKKLLIGAGVIAVVAVGGVSVLGGRSSGEEAVPQVEVVKAEISDVQQTVEASGTLKSKFSRRNLPNERLRLKIKRRKKPATVGGRTSGIVRIPSRTALEPGLSFMIFLAQKIPRKNAIVVATTPVLRDIHRGLQFISCKNSIIVLFPLYQQKGADYDPPLLLTFYFLY